MSRTSKRFGDLIRLFNNGRLVPLLENSGPDHLTVLEKDDLQEDVITTLTTYASAVTVQIGNEFPVTNVQSTFGLEDTNGNPAALIDPGSNRQEHYSGRFQNADIDGISPENLFNNTSHSGQLDVDEVNGGIFSIKKGKTSTPGPTGTEIIQDINDNGENSGFSKRIRKVQLDNNRLTLGNPFGVSGQGSFSEDEANIGVAFVQQDFGKHQPRKFPSVENTSAVLLQLKDLKKIGLLTSLEASGEFFIPQNPDDVAQQLAARGASLAPGLARLGQKIDIARINAIKVMKHINPGFTKPILDDNIKRDPVLSYGNPNSWMVPFNGLNSTSSIACAALLTLTIGGLLKGAAVLLSSRKTSSRTFVEANPDISKRRKRLGSYLGKASESDPFKDNTLDLDIVETTNEYFQCISRGIDIFFGFNAPGKQAQKILDNHGYYNVVFRSIVRNTTDFIKIAAGGIVNPSGVQDVNDVSILGNPLGDLELLQKLNSSQLLRFCNIMATIGDVALNHEAVGYIINGDGEVDEVISDIDKIIETAEVGPNNNNRTLNPGILQSKSRLSDKYRNALAWGSNTIKSMYLFPDSLHRAQATLLGSQDQSTTPVQQTIEDLSRNGLNNVKEPDTVDGNRLSAQDVADMEKYLDAAYMPFYFHDIRTNEIISFHAFMEEMADGFDAEYTEVDGYGRIGSVMIYKNTKRTISFAFRIVSTNEEDFNHMWWKINKLVTLVYPQFTQGRIVGTSTDKFIQPFSQLPSASPLVRIRMGDIWKTNYSRFALARLFGAGTNQFKLEGADGTFQYQRNLLSQRNEVSARMDKGDFKSGEAAFIKPIFTAGNGSQQRLAGYARVDSNSDSPSQPFQNQRRGRAGRTGAGNSTAGFLRLQSDGPPTHVQSNGPPLVIHGRRLVRIVSKQNDGSYKFTMIEQAENEEGTYLCGPRDLSSDPKEVIRVAFNQSQNGQTSSNTNDGSVISTFFSPDGDNGNSVIKSFESTKGKGLAGFIKAIRFDWNDARWETERDNARAPMSVKVNIEFAPIHDITPGLDSDGFMTAPVYNVGETIKNFDKNILESQPASSLRDSLFPLADVNRRRQ